MISISRREGRESSSVKYAIGSFMGLDRLGGENTDEYCDERISHISWGDVISLLLIIRGPMPPFTT